LLFILPGLLLAARGLFGLWRSLRMSQDWRRAEGVVVDVKSRFEMERAPVGWGIRIRPSSRHTVFEFGANGLVYRVCDPLGGSSSPNVGSIVRVIYDPASPDDARIYSSLSLWASPIVYVLSGVVWTLLLASI